MKAQYNLLGERVDDGLRKIGAIKDIDDGPHGRFEIQIECDALPLREHINEETGEIKPAIMLIDERKLHWTPYIRKNRQQTDRKGNPVWGRDGAKCRRCGCDRAPEWNGAGRTFQCPQCSSTDIERRTRRPFKLHYEPKAVARNRHKNHRRDKVHASR